MKPDIQQLRHCTASFWQSFTTWLCAPPYAGVPLLGWLYIIFSFLYTHGPVFHGQLAWFDDNVRMVQILEWINGVHGWYDHILMRVNAPEGFRTIWSRLIDIPYAAVIVAFQGLIGQRPAIVVAVTIIPMLEVLMLFYAAAYFATPLIGRDRANLITLFVLFTPCINAEYFSLAGFEMGAVSHHSWYILLGLMLFGSAIRLLTDPDRKTTCVMVASGVTLLLVGIEAFPLLAATGFMLACIVFDRRDTVLAHRAAMAYGLIAVIGALAQPINHPPAEWLKVSFAEASILGPILAATAAIFFAIEERIVGQRNLRRWQMLAILGIVAAGIGGCLIAFFPQLLDGAAAGLSPEERALAHREHTEANGLYRVSVDTMDYIRLIVPPSLAFLWGFYLLRRRIEPEKRPIILYHTGLTIITFLYASIFSRLVFYMALSSCVLLLNLWLDLAAHVKNDGNANLKKFLLYILVGPLWFMLVPAANYNSEFGEKVLLFPAKRQFIRKDCDASGIAEYLRYHYSNDNTIMVQMYLSDKFLYLTDLKIFFLANFPSQNKWLKVWHFFHAKTDDEAHDIIKEGHVDLVAVCKYATDPLRGILIDSPIIGYETFEQKLVRNEIPDWLKPVQLNQNAPKFIHEPYLLFEVVKDNHTPEKTRD